MKKTLLIIIVTVATTITFNYTISQATEGGHSNSAIISFDCDIIMKPGKQILIEDCEITGLVPKRTRKP